MRTKLRSKATLLFLTLGVLLAFAGVALADVIIADGDTVQLGTQAGTQTNPISMGTVKQGGSVSKQVSFQLVCNQDKHVDNGQTVTLSGPTVSSGAPAGSVSATDATIGPIPAS